MILSFSASGSRLNRESGPIGYRPKVILKGFLFMKYTVKKEYLDAKEFLVIKGLGKLYDPGVSSADSDKNAWDIIKQRLIDGSVECLKEISGSNIVYMLFCNTCIRNDKEKCYDCGYDIACENINNSTPAEGFEIVRINPCEYVVFDCSFNNETSMPNAHEKTDAVFWKEWLAENPYVSAIDNPANWLGNGFAAIELYSPFNPDANKFDVKMWYPVISKDS